MQDGAASSISAADGTRFARSRATRGQDVIQLCSSWADSGCRRCRLARARACLRMRTLSLAPRKLFGRVGARPAPPCSASCALRRGPRARSHDAVAGLEAASAGIRGSDHRPGDSEVPVNVAHVKPCRPPHIAPRRSSSAPQTNPTRRTIPSTWQSRQAPKWCGSCRAVARQMLGSAFCPTEVQGGSPDVFAPERSDSSATGPSIRSPNGQSIVGHSSVERSGQRPRPRCRGTSPQPRVFNRSDTEPAPPLRRDFESLS